jgi:predicted polyphosphate/ATP-dependent NAD kinase
MDVLAAARPRVPQLATRYGMTVCHAWHATRLAAIAECVDDQRECRGRLPARRVIEVVARERRRPVVEDAYEPSLAHVLDDRADSSDDEAHRLKENVGAADVTLTTDDLRTIGDALASIKVEGDRYPAHLAARVGR